ncbi:MAG: hypothetical protein SF053_12655 [Bacteroidia bacterium]|nr:hypothetical protein [Bacteroidia bacterium]
MELSRFNALTPGGHEAITRQVGLLLEDYQVYQQYVQQLRWDRRLRPFLDFSGKIQQLYGAAEFGKTVVAEHLITMGHTPSVMGSTLLPSPSRMQVPAQVQHFDDAVRSILRATRQLLETVRETYMLATQYQDKRTAHLMAQLAQQLGIALTVFSGVRSAAYN